MAFFDYKKVFNLVENYYIWQALKHQQVPMPIISVLKKIYDNAKLTFCIGDTSVKHLIFANDIVIFSHSPKQLQCRIDELITASSIVGLKVNVKKTKIMMNFPGTALLSISSKPFEEVNEFVYLGLLVSFPRDHYSEMKRRVQARWNAYRKYKHFLAAPAIAMKLKRQLFNMVIVPTMLFSAETWALTKQA
uniref:Reverse transcriptase domain-containing protein n=1 Tax=Plectus sambesii TaxID=2011161 RepID=A0A914W3X0_9BILA